MAAVEPKKAQIPGKYLNDAGDDFALPMANLLVGLGLLGTDNQNQKDGLNELKEGALGISRWLGALVGATGLVGLATSLGGVFGDAKEPTRVAMIAGGSLIAAGGLIALAFIVRGDVGARVGSAVAQYEARTQVSTAFLALMSTLLRPAAPTTPTTNGASSESLLSTLTAMGQSLRVKAKNHDDELRVVGVRRVPGGELQIRLEDGDWVPASDIETFCGERKKRRLT
jgi:hypothetical protein